MWRTLRCGFLSTNSQQVSIANKRIEALGEADSQILAYNAPKAPSLFIFALKSGSLEIFKAQFSRPSTTRPEYH